MNEHIIIGNLGKDPEVRFTQSGKAVTTLSVGCNRSYVDKNKEQQQMTDWVRVVAFGALAESAGDKLLKGDKVVVAGRVTTRSYNDKNGEKRYITETVATHIGKLLAEYKPKNNTKDDTGFDSMGSEADEEIPF
nr:MAG TPA: Single strand binding protein [Caudoviricetes sp.]